RRSVFHPLFAFGLLLTCVALIVNNTQTQAIFLPVLLFLGCMICHGELVRLKPNVTRLTSFYLSISAGGAAGGVFVALAAPHLFKFYMEFQLTLGAIVILLLACLILDPASWMFERGVWLPAAITVGVILAAYLGSFRLYGIPQFLAYFHFYPIAVAIGVVVVLGAYFQGRSQARE